MYLQVWRILFQRLQTARTKKYTAGLLTFLAWLICKQGPAAVQSSVDRVQPGLFRMLLDHVWFPTMSSIKAHDQEKLLFIATTQVCCNNAGPLTECISMAIELGAIDWRLMLVNVYACLSCWCGANTRCSFQVLCEAPAMQTPDSATLWGQLLHSLLAQMDNRAPAAEVCCCKACFNMLFALLQFYLLFKCAFELRLREETPVEEYAIYDCYIDQALHFHQKVSLTQLLMTDTSQM